MIVEKNLCDPPLLKLTGKINLAFCVASPALDLSLQWPITVVICTGEHWSSQMQSGILPTEVSELSEFRCFKSNCTFSNCRMQKECLCHEVGNSVLAGLWALKYISSLWETLTKSHLSCLWFPQKRGHREVLACEVLIKHHNVNVWVL